MGKLTTPAKREIIEDFAKEIADRKETGPKPTMDVINFRDDVRVGREREVYLLPTGLLRYRKDNGRITSDVLSYEKQHRPIDEKTDEGQAAIRGFLEQKDRERTEELKRSIFHDAQRSPAIVTCDGFLINGNRRKMAIEVLYEETQDVRFSTMKVVILPGKDDEGGTPTILEIEEIENRCQLQSDGRADYTSFDRALSMRRKELHGMSLERQLKDDPTYAHLSEKEFKKAVEDDRKKYLLPLKCIDRYLNHLKRDGLYETVSSGIGDKEGRWQAFHDYYNYVYQKLENAKQRTKLGISDTEVGDIEDVAFKIIRMRELPGLEKVHKVVRDLPKWLGNADSRKELLELGELKLHLPKKERTDEKGVEYDEREIDKIWARKYTSEVVRQVKRAKQLHGLEKDHETPLALLEAALGKLTHENMNPKAMQAPQLSKALKIAEKIEKRASDLKGTIYRLVKRRKG